MIKSCCTCRECRLTIRRGILRAFAISPRWLGVEEIWTSGRLGWMPDELYIESIDRAAELGVLVESRGPVGEPSRYLHWRLAAGDSSISSKTRRPWDSAGGAP